MKRTGTQPRKGEGAAAAKAAPKDETIELLAARAETGGSKCDAATLQFLRESLWKHLVDEPNPDEAAKTFKMIMDGRRQHLAEKQARGKIAKRQLTDQEMAEVADETSELLLKTA